MYPGSFTQAAIPFTSGSPWCQPASTTKLALNSVCSIPIKPSSQHHPSHFHSSVHVVGETRPNHLGRPHVPLISLAISCHPVLLLSPSQAQLPPAHRWPWEGSALVPCQERYKLHHINFWDWRDRSSVQLPILKMHKVEKEQSIHVSLCVNVEPVKAQHSSQDRVTDTGFSPYWASSRLPLHTYQMNLNECSTKRKWEKVFDLSSW